MMLDRDRLKADAEQAENQSETARLLYPRASRDALVRRWDKAQANRRSAREDADTGDVDPPESRRS